MFKTISPSAVLEIRRLNQQLSNLMAKPGLTRGEAKRADVLIAQISAIKDAGITDDEYRLAHAEALGIEIHGSAIRAREAHEKIFKMFVSGRSESEIATAITENRDFQAGQQTPSFTQGLSGGVLVPTSVQKSISEGLAAVDPLLDPEVCTVVQEPDFSLQPLQLPGWDLSTIQAAKVTEALQHGSDVIPGVTQKLLNKYTYRLSLGASLEWEEDQRVFDRAMAAMGRAYGIGFARAIGYDLINGDGSTAPSGILQGLPSTVTTANAGKIVADDITGVYFSVNKIYRASEKCAWLMNDAAYKLVRQATDDNGRPLINMVGDSEQLMGKPVYICPSLPDYNASLGTQAAGSFCVFGDLSHYTVHVSTTYLRRRLQLPGYVENGKALFTGLIMADAALHDPTDGSMPPVVAATLRA
jgi:HK97 family phage major capsid protein